MSSNNRLLFGFGLFLLNAAAAFGQTAVGPITNYTPAAMAAGSPDGVRILSPNETVNLFNGNLAFTVPLHTVTGRGNSGFTMVLPIGTKWNIENHPNSNANVFVPIGAVYPADVEWPSGTGVARYTPGRILIREAVDDSTSGTFKCVPAGEPGSGYTFHLGQTLTRVVWIEADGTEHEFRDTLNNGAPLPAQTPANYTCQTSPTAGPSRGRTFQSYDATAETFVADAAVSDAITTGGLIAMTGEGVAGWLLLKDGTRYYSDSNGDITTIVDRLGNKTTFNAGTITDSLGRPTTVTYADLSGNTAPPVYDTITYPAAGGKTHTISVGYQYLNSLQPGIAQTLSTLFPTTNGSSQTPFNPLVVSSISLPDGSSYTFQYNAYGELTRVTLPAGGVYEYDYPATMSTGSAACNAGGCILSYSQNDPVSGGTQEQAVLRRVLARRVYPNGSTLEGQTCYAATFPSNADTTVQVTYYGGDAQPGCSIGTLISSESHTFIGSPSDAAPPPPFYEGGAEGREISAQWISADSSTPKSTASVWQVDSNNYGQPGQNATVCQTNTTLGGATPVTSAAFMLYDQYWNVSDTYEYDYGAAPPIPLSCPSTVPTGWTRDQHASYIADGVYDVVASTATPGPDSNHMRNLVQEQDVYAPATPSPTLVAKTTYAYDNSDGQGAVLTQDPVSVGYAAPTHSKLGNMTSKTTYKGTTAQPSTTYGYDQLGNVVGITDPKKNQTVIYYTDQCDAGPGGTLSAFPTQVVNPLSQTIKIRWDCAIGKQTQYTDANKVPTTYSYGYSYSTSTGTPEPFDRLKQVQRALGVAGSPSPETHIAFSYPNLQTVTTNQDQTTKDDGAIMSTVLYDGLGRKTGTRSYLQGYSINVDQTYDGKGRPYKVSLPYNSNGGTEYYTTTTYDGANRPVSVTTDDKAATTTSYNGNVNTTTDPAGAARRTTTDALGRLKSVTEDPNGLAYVTTYNYDLLDDLISVSQGSQTRSFQYNSLKQLVFATNPESGTVCYGSWVGGVCTENYDANGNLSSRVDARNITTQYSYDNLNRPTLKTYSDGTPTVTMAYDSGGGCPNSAVAYNVGRLTAVTTPAVTAGGWTVPLTSQTIAYDALGRACTSAETVGTGSPSSFAYQYNLAGGITSETYPSQRVVATSYDLQNRPWSVSAGTTTYVNSTNTSYAPQGALAQLQFGTAASPVATQTFTYDPVREQPIATTVTAGGTAGAQLLSLGYAYCPGGSSCSTNNGNPLSQQITTPPMLNATTNTIINQTYVYDKLNRLALAVENPTAAPNTQSPVCQGITGASWCQQYSPGEYGNNVTSSVNLGTFSAPAAFDNTTNRISPNNGASGWNYDFAGNLNRDSANATYAFDAEGRMTAACPNQSNPALCTNQWATGQIAYTYDGDGKRVQVNRADGTSTTYVYDGSGSLAAEYGAEPGIAASGTQYMVSDFLGSTRMVLSSSGCPQSRQDYLPFGYLIPASIGAQRSQIVDPCYSSTVSTYSEDAGVRQKFTGKERDAETGLDYFGARYFSSAQGRFNRPDPMGATRQKLLDPEQWNMYAYARNNPLAVIDPDGRANFAVFNNFSLPYQPGDSGPNWAAIQAAAEKNGHTVTFHYGPEATVEAYNKAIGTKDMNVIDIGHSSETNGFTAATGIHLANNQGVGDGMLGNGVPMTPVGEVQATSVTILACNSFTLGGQYANAQVFTGVNSGSNGTNSVTLESAGASFLQSATSQPAAAPVNFAGAAAAAQSVIDNSTILTPYPDGPSQNIDKGDTVVQTHRKDR